MSAKRTTRTTRDAASPRAARSSAGATLVYVGPTLPADEVRAALPAATVLPPAAVGDILRATRRRGVSRIAIVDGYFERMAAVWHKEILVALERGIAVYGAASMGALRAAELAPFGMIGVGAIYRDFLRGTLVRDDEVAVAHLPAEHGYRAVSDALVNLRHGLAAAAQARVIDASLAARLVGLAAARFYRERSWARLIADARALLPGGRARRRDQLPARAARQLDALAAWPKPDRKADDARMLLRRLSDERSERDNRARTASFRVPRTWALRQLESLVR